jgi:hypothetical protein
MQFLQNRGVMGNTMVLLVFAILIESSGSLAASIHSFDKQVKSGAVASEDKACSQIGIDLMKAGGNAADAVCSSSESSKSMLTVTFVGDWNYALCRNKRLVYQLKT